MGRILNVRQSFLLTLILAVMAAYWAAPSHAADTQEYRFGPGDVVKVSVFQQPDLTTVSRISERGSINFPFLGDVEIGGLTISEAEKRIAEGLRSGGYIKQPQVTLTIETYRSRQVSVLGEVKKPGKYAIEGVSSVVDMLAAAGGTTETAHDVLTLVRSSGGKSQRFEVDLLKLYNGDITQNLEVVDGDFITIPQMHVFYIYGEVRRPDSYRLQRDMTIMQALSLAGGLTERATQKGIEVTRRNAAGESKTSDANLGDRVNANDVIFVKESLF